MPRAPGLPYITSTPNFCIIRLEYLRAPWRTSTHRPPCKHVSHRKLVVGLLKWSVDPSRCHHPFRCKLTGLRWSAQVRQAKSRASTLPGADSWMQHAEPRHFMVSPSSGPHDNAPSPLKALLHMHTRGVWLRSGSSCPSAAYLRPSMQPCMPIACPSGPGPEPGLCHQQRCLYCRDTTPKLFSHVQFMLQFMIPDWACEAASAHKQPGSSRIKQAIASHVLWEENQLIN